MGSFEKPVGFLVGFCKVSGYSRIASKHRWLKRNGVKRMTLFQCRPQSVVIRKVNIGAMSKSLNVYISRMHLEEMNHVLPHTRSNAEEQKDKY